MKKFLTILFLVALIPLCYVLTAHAADTVTMEAKSFTQGKPSSVNASSISLSKGQSVGFDIDFAFPPTEISFICSNDAKHSGAVEIHLDSVSGPVIAKTATNPNVEWVRVTYSVPVSMDLSGPHTVWFTFQGLSTDFVSLSFVIQDPADMYENFTAQADAFKDIADSPIRTQINILADLGILNTEQENFDSERLVSKRDYLRSVSAFYQDTIVGLQEEQLFADVSASDKDYNLVKWLCGTGVLKADPYSNLNLDSSISFDEAIGYLVGLLEYDNEVALRGGVYQTANRLGILKGVNVSATSDVKNKDMVKLLWNALQSKYNNTVSVSSKGLIRYKSEDDVLEYTGFVNGGEDIIYANQNTNIYSGNKAPVSAVLIDNEVYYVGNTDAAKYLGFSCIYYYEEVDGVKTLLAARPSMYVDYLSLSSQDVEFDAITDDLVTYYKDNDEKNCRFSNTATIVYNGTRTTENLETLVKLHTKDKFNGRVLLVDNDNDGRYDVVMVDQARTIVFGGYTMDNDSTSVYDLLEKDTINAGKDTRVILLYGTNGGSWANAKPGTVMDVYVSDGIIRFVPSLETVTGTVVEISKDGNITSVIMDDGSVYEAYDKNNSDLIIGETVTLKLNTFGQYVTFSKTTSSNIGIVLGAGVEEDGLEKTARIRLLTESNEKIIFDFADRVTCDGKVYKKQNDIGKYLQDNKDNLKNGMVVLYNLNGSNKITMLDTLKKDAGGKYDVLKPTVGESSDNMVKGTYICVADSDPTPLGVVSNSLKAANVPKNGNEDQYEFIKFTSGKAPFEGYSTKYNSVTGETSMLTDFLIIRRAAKAPGNDRDPSFIVTNCYDRLDSEGEIEKVIEGMNKGGSVKYVIDSYTYNGDVVITNADNPKVSAESPYNASEELRKAIDAIKPGDLVQPAADTAGKVTFIAVNYFGDGRVDAGGCIPGIPGESGTAKATTINDGSGGIYKGTVQESEDGFVKIDYTDVNGNTRDTFIDGNTTKIYAVTLRNGNAYVETVGSSWLKVGEEVLVTFDSYEYKPAMAVVYRR